MSRGNVPVVRDACLPGLSGSARRATRRRAGGASGADAHVRAAHP